MQASEKEAIKLLRSQIPIGVSESVTLLKKHNFNLDLSITEWKINTVKAFASKNSVTDEEANTLLISNGWRKEKAFQTIIEQRFTLTERTLQSSEDLDTILSRISRLIVETNPWLKQDIPIATQEKLEKLNLYQGKFYTLWNWLEYYLYYEGFEVALDVEHIQTIVSILNELELEAYADTIINALERKRVFHQEYGNPEDFDKNFSKYINFCNALAKDTAFSQYDELFRLNQEPLYKRLVAFVKAYKDYFPA